MLEFSNLPANDVSEAREIRQINEPITFVAAGTFGGDTLTLQVFALGQWLDVTDGVDTCELTTAGMKVAEIRGTISVRVKRTGAAGTSLRAGLL